MKKLFRVILLIGSALVLGLLLSSIFFVRSMYSKPLDTDVCIIEGWLTAIDLEQFVQQELHKKYNTIYITGTTKIYNSESSINLGIGDSIPSNMYYNEKIYLSGNGIYYLPPNVLRLLSTSENNVTLEFSVYSNTIFGKSSHLSLLLNDTIVAQTFTSDKWRRYSSNIPASVLQSGTIGFGFSNDVCIDNEDRNLVLADIKLNGKNIMDWYRQLPNADTNIRLQSLMAYEYAQPVSLGYLQALGVNPVQIIGVPVESIQGRNKTKTSAKKFREQMELRQYPHKRLNVVTTGIHSKRSMLTYRKIFRGSNTRFGTISLSESFPDDSQWYTSWEGIKIVANELLSYLVVVFSIYK